MKLPAFPNHVTVAALKKKAPPFFHAPNAWSSLALIGAKPLSDAVGELESAFGAVDPKSFDELERAIKTGTDVIAKYQALGAEFDKISSYAQLAAQFKAGALQSSKQWKRMEQATFSKWLLKIAPVFEDHAAVVEKLGDDLLAKAESLPSDKITDLKWDLNTWDLAHLLTKVLKVKLTYIELPDKKPVDVSITGKVGAQAASNATLRHEFFTAAYDTGKKLGAGLKSDLEKLDKAFADGKVQAGQLPGRIQATFVSFEKEYAKKADAAIQAVWDDYCKDKREYRSYQIKTGISIGTKVGGLVSGVVATVGSGWTGVGTVVGVVGCVKSATELGTQLYDAWLEAKQLSEQINDALESLQKKFASESKALRGAEEVAKDALNRLTGIRTTSVKSVGDKVKLFGSKLQGCRTKAVAMGKAIDRTLKDMDGLKKKINKMGGHFRPSGVFSFKTLDKKLAALEKSFGKLIAAAASQAGDAVDGKKAIVTYKSLLGQLEGDIPELAKKIQTWAVPLLDFAYVNDAPGAITTAVKLSRDFAQEALGVKDDLESANQVLDFVGDTAVSALLG